MPLVVFFVIGIIVASQEWHESFFWSIIGLTTILIFLDIGLGIKKLIRIAKEDYEENKRNGVIK